MPPQSDTPADARRWLRYARANIAHAEAGRAAGIMTEYLCFDAQQAAEKALKAAPISRGVHFPRVHDLGELLRLLKDAGLQAPDLVKEAVNLNPFAAQVRYPGWGEPPTEGDLEEALFGGPRCHRLGRAYCPGRRGVADWGVPPSIKAKSA